MENKTIVFTTKDYSYFVERLSDLGWKSRERFGIGKIKRISFPDGEAYHCFDESESVHNRDVVVIGGTDTDANTLELFDMCYHLAKDGVRTLTIVIPYFGYSTMERAVKSGEIVKAKTRAVLLSSIPPTMRNRIVFMDLHAEGIPHYMEGSIQPVHLYAKPLIETMCRKAGGDGFVLGSTDAGRAKWVESLARDMGVDCGIITKRRLSGSSTEVSAINADVKDKTVVIYDDMIRTGGSLIGAANAYLGVGAKEVHAVATHGVLPGDSADKLFNSGVFKSISVTNTHPRSAGMLFIDRRNFFKIYDVNEIIFDYLLKN